MCLTTLMGGPPVWNVAHASRNAKRQQIAFSCGYFVWVARRGVLIGSRGPHFECPKNEQAHDDNQSGQIQQHGHNVLHPRCGSPGIEAPFTMNMPLALHGAESWAPSQFAYSPISAQYRAAVTTRPVPRDGQIA